MIRRSHRNIIGNMTYHERKENGNLKNPRIDTIVNPAAKQSKMLIIIIIIIEQLTYFKVSRELPRKKAYADAIKTGVPQPIK